MEKFVYFLFGAVLSFGLSFWITGRPLVKQSDPAVPSVTHQKIHQVSELRLARKQVEGLEVFVKGFIYKGEHSWVWLCPTSSGNFDKTKSLQLADFPFDLKDNSWSREVTVVGRYGCLDEELGFDGLAPLKSIHIGP